MLLRLPANTRHSQPALGGLNYGIASPKSLQAPSQLEAFLVLRASLKPAPSTLPGKPKENSMNDAVMMAPSQPLVGLQNAVGNYVNSRREARAIVKYWVEHDGECEGKDVRIHP